MSTRELLVELRDVVKDYRGLRPLRVARLQLHQGQSIALVGFDKVAAEVLVNLVTGAMLPDRGEVIAFGQPTQAITDADAWVTTLDRFGLVSDRAVFLDQLNAEQNLAVPFSLELDDLPAEVRHRVKLLAEEVGLAAEELRSPMANLNPAARVRVRLGRALALQPRVLLAEHPNAMLERADTAPFAADLARIIGQRSLGALVVTADTTFAQAVGDEVLTVQPATGELKPSGGWRRWFS
jgi:ABC-type transporter Mla maintaining outer membrane lipid asymmetry ATPase subunit MlaF